MFNVNYDDRAKGEYHRQIKWYTSKAGKKIAEAFIYEIEEQVAAIMADALRFRFYIEDVRKSGPTKVFNFNLYYLVDGIEVVILGVAHPKRKPDYWLRRRARR